MAFRTFVLRIAAAASHRKPIAPGQIELDSLALYLREFEDKESAEAQGNWINQYKSGMRKRDKILALKSHLSANIEHLERISEEQDQLTSSQSSKPQQYSRELLSLYNEYCEQIRLLQKLEKSKPPGKLARDFLLKRDRKPCTKWMLERIDCHLRGGCCLRQCGCCERWSGIQIGSGSAKSMHCDSDCDCCARYKRSIANTSIAPSSTATALLGTSVVPEPVTNTGLA